MADIETKPVAGAEPPRQLSPSQLSPSQFLPSSASSGPTSPQRAREQGWLDEHAEAIDAHNRQIESEGLVMTRYLSR